MLNLSISEIQEKIDIGELTYEALTHYYLGRIEAYNEQVNAVSEINPNAIKLARSLDEEFKLSGRRSILHGIPVMIKDNINIASDGFHTTAGAIALKDMKSTYDAFIVKKLKSAGAIILGKTNLTEFANFISDTSPNGFSALKGQVKNPYGKFDVGGSSSGSGVAVACGFCQVAIGTETSGSIISPASCNSIIGLKPSVGVVSRHGIIPISATQDVPGPMARCIDDVAAVQSIIEGFDQNDDTTKVLLQQTFRDMKLDLPVKKLEHLRLGVYEGEGATRKGSDLVFDAAIRQLKSRGILTEVLTFDSKEFKVNWEVLYYEFPKSLKQYLATMSDATSMSSLEDVMAFNEEDAENNIPYNQKQFDTALAKQESFDENYEQVLRESFQYGQLIDQWLLSKKLDVICYVDCDAIDIAARKGHPSLTFPIGYTEEGKPVGFTMTGPLYSEKLLMSIAKQLMAIIGEHKKICVFDEWV